MSSTSKTYSNNASTKKGSCLFCFKAGKSAEECSSHFLRSLPDRLSGVCKVTCPLLLNTVCLSCGAKGHTPNNCPNQIANNKNAKNWNKNARRANYQTAERSANQDAALTVKNVNKFAALEENDRFHEPQISRNQQKKQEKQQSDAVNQTAGAKPGNTWASIVTTAPKPVEKAGPAKLSIVHPQTMMTADKPAVLRRETRTNWADAIESDDDSEDDLEQDAWEEQIRRTDDDSYGMSKFCDM
jgi:hypothetical protein